MSVERKVLAIPYIRQRGRKTKFLVVQDRTTNDWTFISGTCETNEPPVKCVLRELFEETKGLISLGKLPKRVKRFRIVHERKRIDVFFIPLRLSHDEEMRRISQEFHDIESDIPEFQENIQLRFETLAVFLRKKNVWSFIRDVIDTHDFVLNCPGGVFH